ncbi:galactose oxidase/kelch repeat superfamily protein, partial [Striga asiatica]
MYTQESSCFSKRLIFFAYLEKHASATVNETSSIRRRQLRDRCAGAEIAKNGGSESETFGLEGSSGPVGSQQVSGTDSDSEPGGVKKEYMDGCAVEVAVPSGKRIKCFYLIYNHGKDEDDHHSFSCFALNKGTADTSAFSISPAPGMTKPLPIYLSSAAVALGSTIYIIGGLCRPDFFPEGFFDVLRSEDGWWEAAPMHIPRLRPAAAAIDGKIYVLGGSDMYSPDDGECFDPKTNRWELLPSAGYDAGLPYIVCPYVSRDVGKSILVHSACDGGTLHAYVLATREWDLVSRDFSECDMPAAVVGDFMYTLLNGRDKKRRPLHGYHLIHKKWIPVDIDPEKEFCTEDAWLLLLHGDLYMSRPCSQMICTSSLLLPVHVFLASALCPVIMQLPLLVILQARAKIYDDSALDTVLQFRFSARLRASPPTPISTSSSPRLRHHLLASRPPRRPASNSTFSFQSTFKGIHVYQELRELSKTREEDAETLKTLLDES